MTQDHIPQENWEGSNVTNRLGVWYDEDMKHWTVSGREERLAGTGSAGDMTALARMILENILDNDGLPAQLGDEDEQIPREAYLTLQSALRLARTGGDLDPEQQHRAGGLLMAAGIHLIQQALRNGADWPGPVTGPSRLPFSLSLNPREEE